MTGALSISSELRAHKVYWRVFPEITAHTSSLSSGQKVLKGRQPEISPSLNELRSPPYPRKKSNLKCTLLLSHNPNRFLGLNTEN